MTRAKISEYDAVAANNTDVNGVNISEGSPPSSMNNMGREIMAALKRFQTGADGDSVTVGGSLVVSNTLTAGPVSATTLNTSGQVVFNDAGADVDFRVEGDTDANLLFVDASADKVGIGASPTEKLSVSSNGVAQISITNSSGTTKNTQLIFRDNAGVKWRIGMDVATNNNTNIFQIYNDVATAAAMSIDSSGNVGIGTSTPKLNGNAGTFLSVIGTNANGWLELGTTSQTDGLGGALTFNNTNIAGSDKRVAQITSGRAGADNSAYLAFSTWNAGTGAERARITSGGYFKAADNGSYYGPTSNYHEFITSQDNVNLLCISTNGSYSSQSLNQNVYRSANSAYSFLLSYSSNFSDLEFNLRGDGNAYADGSWNGSGADYAEYFESAGETIPRGTTVVLDNNKVRAATENDPASSIIGVVRPKEFGKGSMVVGNLAWNMWTDKYITDDFGVYEMEDHDVLEWEEQVLKTEAVEAVVDEEGNEVSHAQKAVYKTVNHSYESHAVPEGVTVPADATRKTHDEKGKKFQHRKLNPAWSADVEYTPREERPEWHIIGLLGQVPVLKGQPVGDRWIKMRDISETVEEWFIR